MHFLTECGTNLISTRRNFFQRLQIALTCNCACLWKKITVLMCFFITNCTQNHVITYTNVNASNFFQLKVIFGRKGDSLEHSLNVHFQCTTPQATSFKCYSLCTHIFFIILSSFFKVLHYIFCEHFSLDHSFKFFLLLRSCVWLVFKGCFSVLQTCPNTWKD